MDLSKYDFFFALLRSGLYGTGIAADDIPPDPDWDQICSDARIQTVLPLVGDAISRLPDGHKAPKDITDRLKKFAFRNMQSNILINANIHKVFGLLRQHGVNPVLLKGQGLAQCYINPLLRQCGDIDVYVGPRQYDKACEVAIPALHDGAEEPHADAKHMGIEHNNVDIELHRYVTIMQVPWHNRIFQPWVESHLDDISRTKKVKIGDVEVSTPDDDFNAFFVFYHLWHHLLTGGVGVRHLCDMAMFLHHNRGNIDIPELQKLLDKLGMTKVWRSVGAILVDRLGLPPEEMPLYEPTYSRKGDKILQPIMEMGNFGHYADASLRIHKSQGFITRKLHNFRRITRISVLTFRAVPSHVALHYTCKSIGAFLNIIAGRQLSLPSLMGRG